MAKPYTSDITQFLQTLKTQHTDLEQQQREGRARLWDKAVDLQDLAIEQANTLPNKGYQYATKPEQR